MRRITEEEREKILAMGKEGIRPYIIANKLMLSIDAVSAHLRRNGIFQEKKDVTEEQVNQIAELWRAGVPCAEIAKKVSLSYGITRTKINKLQKDGVIKKRGTAYYHRIY